jgi:pilus assembly protein CpaB
LKEVKNMSRISPGTAIVGIFAVVFGLIGAYAIRKSLEPAPVAEVAQPPLLAVPVASADLPSGRAIALGDVAIMRLTEQQIQERNFPEGYMTNAQQVIGRTLKEPVTKGTTFMTTDLYPQGIGPSVADKLKPGYRAVTVPIANTAAVSGLVAPGSLVDVFFRTLDNVTEGLPQTTITLLEGVEVLAVDDNQFEATPVRPPATRAQMTVTVAVSPQQASALKVVEGRGELMLALRNPTDADYAADPEPLTLESLLGFSESSPPISTDIYRGSSKQTMMFQESGGVPARITGLPVRPKTRQTSLPADGPAEPDDNRRAATQPETTPAAVTPATVTPAAATSAQSQPPAPAASPEPVEPPPTVSLKPSNPRLDDTSAAASPLSARLNPRPALVPSLHSRPGEPVARVEPMSPAARPAVEVAQQPRRVVIPPAPAKNDADAVPPAAPVAAPTVPQPEPKAAPQPAGQTDPAAGKVSQSPAPEAASAKYAAASVKPRFTTELFSGTSKQKIVFVDGRRVVETDADTANPEPADAASPSKG